VQRVLHEGVHARALVEPWAVQVAHLAFYLSLGRFAADLLTVFVDWEVRAHR
jgi:hypothetical protein